MGLAQFPCSRARHGTDDPTPVQRWARGLDVFPATFFSSASLIVSKQRMQDRLEIEVRKPFIEGWAESASLKPLVRRSRRFYPLAFRFGCPKSPPKTDFCPMVSDGCRDVVLSFLVLVFVVVLTVSLDLYESV